MLWSPLMDRYPLPWLGRRRGWIAVTQIGLFALTLALAGPGSAPDAAWVLLSLATALAFVAASQDIVIDAYAVDVLRPEEHGVAVGARTMSYRLAMQLAGALSITLTAWLAWPLVLALQALFYLPLLVVTRMAPEPEVPAEPPRGLREAVWEPFIGFLGKHRALEILAFVLLYKLADNLSQALLRPFLYDMGYSEIDRGVALGTVGVLATIVGTIAGGVCCTSIGLGHSLWIFGLLQIFSNVGYVLVSHSDVNRPLMYGAMVFEMLTTGAGMGAFGVLLLRITERRFSATQYALFSSIFALPRLAGGPITGFVVHAIGWTPFFWLTMVAGIPGLLMLQRFAPLGTREPRFVVEELPPREPLSSAGLAVRGLAGGLAGFAAAVGIASMLAALEGAREPGWHFSPLAPMARTLRPDTTPNVLTLAGCIAFAAVAGLVTAAVCAARRGATPTE
jgi:PAT family beta-lactamase induction signal transducer AmpG